MNSNGSFRTAIEELHKQASNAMFAILSKCRKFDLPVDVTLDVFDKLDTPVMLFSFEVWQFERIDIMEKLHSNF